MGKKAMTNEELKKQIIGILLPIIKSDKISCNEENACERCWFPCEINRETDKLADALIAAGLRFGENLTATFDHIALEREHELERCFAEATKAMYVYERALYYATLNGETADEVKYNDALKRAQKDFAKNKGD